LQAALSPLRIKRAKHRFPFAQSHQARSNVNGAMGTELYPHREKAAEFPLQPPLLIQNEKIMLSSAQKLELIGRLAADGGSIRRGVADATIVPAGCALAFFWVICRLSVSRSRTQARRCRGSRPSRAARAISTWSVERARANVIVVRKPILRNARMAR